MRRNILISLLIALAVLVSCEEKEMKWINAQDPHADSAAITEICEKNNAECGYIKAKADDGKFHKFFCGGCENGYECNSNRCKDIDECADPSLNNCNNEVSTCANKEGTYSCICKENYSGDDCVPDTRTKECEELPENAEWNTASSITQTWNGTNWEPSTTEIYNEEESTDECRFKCKEHYNWNFSLFACEAETRTADCTGLPENAEWNGSSSLMQTWNGEEWEPSNQAVFNEDSIEAECRFKCKNHYDWDASNSTCIAATQEAHCSEKPKNTIWNDDGANGTFIQVWDGEKWDPASFTSTYSTTSGTCNYMCDTTHTWEKNHCINQKTVICTGLPNNAIWNSVSSITQNWDSSNGWQPSTSGVYNTTESSVECRFKCIADYHWENNQCVSNTRTNVACTGLPENAEWNTVSKITQNWDASNGWQPQTTGVYSTAGSSSQCLFKCKNHYDWDASNSTCIAATQEAHCSEKPENTIWNDEGANGTFIQVWDGEKWDPANFISAYSTTSGTCNYTCDSAYTFENNECINEKSVMCTGLPDNAIWNSVSSITQNWNPSDGWQPLTIGVYNTTESSTECRFKCDDNYFWNNSECTSPCDNDPCEGIVNSTEICIATDWNKYSCECEDSYFWDGTQCKHQKTIGNICTGQTICYNTTDEISCPTLSTEDFFGQDAHYAVQDICTPQSFTIETTIPGQNIVVDNNTGLEWQQASPIEKDNFEDAANYCHNLNYGEINNGWRLPTAKEFLTIIDNNTLNPALDTLYFPNFQTSDSTYCWTSQFYENDIGEIWLAEVSLYYGEIRFRQTNPSCVICVHGKELPDASFTLSTSDNGDVIVTDSISDLMWQKTYETDKTWAQALSYCENLNYAGYSDWRLPNKNEMASLFNYNLGEKPYSDFPDMPSSFFWTSSTSLHNTKFVWIANFNTSYLTNRVTNSVKGSASSKYVRCVRNY